MDTAGLISRAASLSVGICGTLLALGVKSLLKDDATLPAGTDSEKYLSAVSKAKNAHVCLLAPSTLAALCDYNPVSPGLLSLQAFAPVKSNTHCVFARRSIVWGSCDWNVDISIHENVKLFSRAFTLFASLQQGVDGFVVHVPKSIVFSDQSPDSALLAHARTVRNVLSAMWFVFLLVQC